MGIAELRRSVEQPGGQTVRTVPLLERNDRQRQQATRLSGVETEGTAEPSHALRDKAAESYQKNVLTRIEWKERPLQRYGSFSFVQWP